jgi:DNA ligase (NAD+)
MDIKELETKYLKAKIAYYDGNPIMSDATFDILEQGLKDSGSKAIEQVGSKRKDFDFPHPTPMKSLAKFQTSSNNGIIDYQEISFMNWLNKRVTLLTKEVAKEINHIFYTPKFDGSAINIIYRDGLLESVLTRGDGETGKDVTDRFRNHLPQTVADPLFTSRPDSIIEIRCEAVMRKSFFEKKYAEKFANARNLVAGIIGRDDIDVEMISDITLIPLHYIFNGEHVDIKYVKDIMGTSAIIGDPHSTKIRPIIEDYLSSVKYMEKERENFEYPIDGIVFSLPVTVRGFLGENEHDPEWAIAIKFVPDKIISTVTGIEWNLGKTGELTPVVLLKPVELAGTTVKRASGYNAGYIVKHGITKGAIISIAKAGDIIPEIQEVQLKSDEIIDLPVNCPSCEESLEFDGIHLYCENENCEGRIARKLSAAAGMLDLKGIAGKTLEPFAEDFSNMYQLMVAVLQSVDRRELNYEKYGIKHGSRSQEIFINSFKNIKSLTYAQVILMMGYDGVGSKLAEQAAKEYCGLTPDYSSMERALVYMLQDPEKMLYIKNAVNTLTLLGITIDKPVSKSENPSTVYICMTGGPKNFGYKTKEEFISQFANAEEVSITDVKCKYLVTDDYNSTSSKMKIANKKGITITTYGDFYEKFILHNREIYR